MEDHLAPPYIRPEVNLYLDNFNPTQFRSFVLWQTQHKHFVLYEAEPLSGSIYVGVKLSLSWCPCGALKYLQHSMEVNPGQTSESRPSIARLSKSTQHRS